MGVIINTLNRLKKSKNPVKYWRKKGMRIGEECEIYSSADFGSEPYLITIGAHVRITGGVKFITHDGGVWVLRRMNADYSNIDLFGKITVGDNVHIGSDAIIMPGVTIGNNCIIGCGAVVTKNIPDNSVAVGIPARVIESIEAYAHKHEKDFLYTKNMPYKQKREFVIKELLKYDDTE